MEFSSHHQPGETAPGIISVSLRLPARVPAGKLVGVFSDAAACPSGTEPQLPVYLTNKGFTKASGH